MRLATAYVGVTLTKAALRYLFPDGEVMEMLNQIYSSQPNMTGISTSHKYFSADVPPTWRAEVEAWAEIRELPRPGMKIEEAQDCAGVLEVIPIGDQEDDICDSLMTGK